MSTRLAQNLRDDYLSCTICLEQYTVPKSLPCEHVFCELCLINHADETVRDSTIQCPVCRVIVEIDMTGLNSNEQWVKSLPTDTLLSSLIDTLRLHDRDRQLIKPIREDGCVEHEGKAREAYCFTHAQTVCWECAARIHRECSIDSVQKAVHIMEPKLKTLKSKLDEQLKKSRGMCKGDQNFTENKSRILDDIKSQEKRLDEIYESAKKQFSLLKDEVEMHNRSHLEQRKEFYDMVTFLFEMNSTVETIEDSEDMTKCIYMLEKLEEGIELVSDKMVNVESAMDKDISVELRFVVDQNMRRFIQSYSSVGFIDDRFSLMRDDPMSPEPPSSISHLLRREPTVYSVNDETESV